MVGLLTNKGIKYKDSILFLCTVCILLYAASLIIKLTLLELFNNHS